jgi:GT2 family glycosyltransferase
MDPTVFVVIPVYNRLELTRACLGCLREQTYPALRIFVVDCGSTDGTVGMLREHPDVVTLHGEGLWWAGAMKLGIQRALAESRSDDDMVLMLNNDTMFDSKYVEVLVNESRHTGAAVGALIVDSRNPAIVLDAGEFIDWRTYSFPVKTTVAPGEVCCDRVDVLPGRGSLVPLRIIRAVGNVDAETFPHYIADYEFFARVRRYGFPLLVTYQTHIEAHIEQTGIKGGHGPFTLRQAWLILSSRRSMHNFQDHWRFIAVAGPPAMRVALRGRLLWRAFGVLGLQTSIRYALLPFRLDLLCRWIYFVGRSIYYVSARDCTRCGLDAASLTAQGILSPWLRPDWFRFVVRRQEWWSSRPEIKPLYLRAWNPLTKPGRWLAARRHVSAARRRARLDTDRDTR